MPSHSASHLLAATDLRLATFRLARRLRTVRAADSISDAQLAVLGRLKAAGSHTVTSLATDERVTAPSMTNLINSLAEQGFAIRIPDEDDRRRVRVEITSPGRELVAETIRRRDALLADMLHDLELTTAELDLLCEASELMRRVADA